VLAFLGDNPPQQHKYESRTNSRLRPDFAVPFPQKAVAI
jgi:hypothetical protein